MSQLVKAGPNTASYPSPTDMDGIKAWMAGSAAAAALVATNNAYTNFLNGPFTSWKMNYETGRAEEPAPGVPSGFDALMTDDGLDYQLVLTASPSGPVPAYTKRNLAPPPPPGSIKSALPALGLLIGQIGIPITQKDGTIWVRLQ